MHLVAVDTETCALAAGRDRVVQFCVEELDGDMRTLSSWTQLIHPGRPIPTTATAIHGITDAMVRGQPAFQEVAPLLRRLIRHDSIFVAYNAPFDVGVLNLEFARNGQPPIPPHQPVIDPLRIERHVCSRSLGPTHERYFGHRPAVEHRADADVRAMVEVLRAQRRVHAGKLPPELAQLVGWPPEQARRRRQPHLWKDGDGVVRLGFGRHAGRPAREVPDYLAWMLASDFPAKTKSAARRILEDATLA